MSTLQMVLDLGSRGTRDGVALGRIVTVAKHGAHKNYDMLGSAGGHRGRYVPCRSSPSFDSLMLDFSSVARRQIRSCVLPQAVGFKLEARTSSLKIRAHSPSRVKLALVRT